MLGTVNNTLATVLLLRQEVWMDSPSACTGTFPLSKREITSVLASAMMSLVTEMETLWLARKTMEIWRHITSMTITKSQKVRPAD